MIKRIAKSISIALRVAVISFDQAFKRDHGIDDILGYTDDLTGLLNLKAFERDKARVEPDYALVLIDVDDFKLMNDCYGHSFGDAILKRIGFILEHSVEFCGTAYRLHGDEFALIVLSWEVERICEEIREHVRAEDTVTISQGVVAIEDNIPFENAFKSADKALYQSKRSGRGGIITMIPAIAS